jgi:hypothetical protein
VPEDVCSRCHCQSALYRLPTGEKAACRASFAWIRGNRRAEDLQNGKLAWPEQEDGREHEANTSSKHCQGSKKQPTKDEQAVPPTHCKYQLAYMKMSRGSVACKCPAGGVVTQELPPVTLPVVARPGMDGKADDRFMTGTMEMSTSRQMRISRLPSDETWKRGKGAWRCR